MPFFSLVTFITVFQYNTYNFWMNRVSVPRDRSKMEITFELKLCLSNFIREIKRQKESYQGTNITLIFKRLVDLFLIPYFVLSSANF